MTTLAGRYEVKEILGGGGFAITYLARDTMQPSKPLCVVKQLRPNQTGSRVIDFFNQEATILEKLGKHSQIPQLLAHFQEDDNLYIVQEFIEGHDLSQEISPGKQLSEAYVNKLLQEVLEVLSFVHQNGVIHRDIKPQNLMRRQEDGKIFLIDFGAVKELGTLKVDTQGEIKSSVVIGTPGYMPNEQSLGKPCLASDVYAVGMIAIQALTGLQPFELEENPQNGEVIWLDKAQVSEHLAKVITKMVHRHHSLRYSCATDALQVLATVGEPTTIAPTELNPPIPPLIAVPKFQVVTAKPQSIKTRTVISKRRTITSASKSKSPINLSRRETIQLLGLAAGGWLVSVLGKELFKIVFFDKVVTVNANGNIINSHPVNAKYFRQYIGSGVSLEMTEIPGGEFLMGSPGNEKRRKKSEEPSHKVVIEPFLLGKFAVTQAQYKAIMGNNPSKYKGKKHPVETVTWNDAIEFCKKLTEKTKRKYRLPSEAEWEYACRAGTKTPQRGSSVAPGGNPHDRADSPFHFGETITTDLVNYDGGYTYASEPQSKDRKKILEVGRFPPNAFGLYDMHGNVWEWCQDIWHENYYGAPSDGSAWIDDSKSNLRLLRGGSWFHSPANCRSASRFAYARKTHTYSFRVACDLKQT